jgi:hypothetical protein
VKTVFLLPVCGWTLGQRSRKIDQSMAIVVEIERKPDRANFPFEIKSEENLTARRSGFGRRQKKFAMKNQRVTTNQNDRVGYGSAMM